MSSIASSRPNLDAWNCKLISVVANRRKDNLCATSFRTLPIAANQLRLGVDSCFVPFGFGDATKFCRQFCGLKVWVLENLNLWRHNKTDEQGILLENLRIQEDDLSMEKSETTLLHDGKVSDGSLKMKPPNVPVGMVSSIQVPFEGALRRTSQHEVCARPDVSLKSATPIKSHLLQQSHLSLNAIHGDRPCLCIAVIGATGELARRKIFPALFALYYSGFLPENIGIFGYSRKHLTDEDLRSIIASTLTCRIDYQQDCDSKMNAFLSRTYYMNGGYDIKEGMSKLSARMEQIEGESKANRIFYLSVPEEALLDVACALADNAQTQKGWNRVIIEKPFGLNSLSSHQLTQSILSKFMEKQLYRIDHLLGRNIIENLTVLRFSNLVFHRLWNRTFIRNVQVILSEELGLLIQGRNFDGHGIIGDVVQSHIFQTIALLAMETPVSLDGEDIRNEKAKVLRSIRKLEPRDVILGKYKANSEDNVDAHVERPIPTFFAAACYIDNARWDGVPFLIKAGVGLSKHRVEIRIQFNHVPGNLYRDSIGDDTNLALNELILRDIPEEVILVRINNKIPGLGMQLEASELNLLYKEKYNAEVPDSYEQLILDVVDGDNHLFMRSDEVAAAWDVLSPVLDEIEKQNITPEFYEFGSKGPVKASQLWEKHGIRRDEGEGGEGRRLLTTEEMEEECE